MKILVTGSTGNLGRLVIDRLVEHGIDLSDVVAGARNTDNAADLGARGVTVVRLDYDDITSVAAALKGIERVLLISGSELGKRVTQHQNVIDAASRAGVSLLAYTSVTRADSTSLPIAPDHLITERALAASALPTVVLRNNWYTENFRVAANHARDTGILPASVGEGRVSAASRADYAEAAAVVLSGDGHTGKTYELAGDTVDYYEIASAMSQVLERDVTYQPLTTAQHRDSLLAAGVDDATAGFITAIDASIRSGELEMPGQALADLIGRPTTSVVEGLRSV